MTAIDIIFYGFVALALSAGFMVIASPHPVRGVLGLVLTFVATAAVWLLLEAEFLALILVLVYVGAVMTLFLFVVMMLKVDTISLREGLVRYVPVTLLVWALVVGLILLAINSKPMMVTEPATLTHVALSLTPNTAALGSVLYTDFAYPFEIAAAMLLAAMVAAITLAHRRPRAPKYQATLQQMVIRRDEHVRLIDMPFEKRLRDQEGDAP